MANFYKENDNIHFTKNKKRGNAYPQSQLTEHQIDWEGQ